jgi:hypothetical protein
MKRVLAGGLLVCHRYIFQNNELRIMNYASEKIKVFVTSVAFLILPNIVFATDGTDEGIKGLVNAGFNLITQVLIPLAFTLCLLYFFWGIVKYIRTGAGSEKEAGEGKKIMIWGIVGLFVAFSVWGIISFIRTELGVLPIQNIDMPSV